LEELLVLYPLCNGGTLAKDIELLHIGDIHYNCRDTEVSSADDKDEGFPGLLKDISMERPYKIILEDLQKEISKSPEAILMSGDLSTLGKIDGYRECLDFIKDCIPPIYFGTKDKLFLAPGNHDVDRRRVSEVSLFPKFDPILDALREKQFPLIPINQNVISEINKPCGNLIIILINSCLGCGEKRYYHDLAEFVPKIFELNKDYENIDTPIFQIEDIKSMIDFIKTKDKSYLPIILTHHNLLTMRKLRFAMYTELINSGYLRDQLLSLDRPVLYLHGHIHDNPVEIIQSPDSKDSKIICISAPLLLPLKEAGNSKMSSNKTKIMENKLGFNKLKIIFNQNMKPLGCEIGLFEYENGRTIISKKRIRFLSSPFTKSQATRRELDLLDLIKEKGMHYLFQFKNFYEEKFNENIDINELHNLVDELDWLGFVDYDRTEEELEMGFIESVVP
jgi:hypothetical protein